MGSSSNIRKPSSSVKLKGIYWNFPWCPTSWTYEDYHSEFISETSHGLVWAGNIVLQKGLEIVSLSKTICCFGSRVPPPPHWVYVISLWILCQAGKISLIPLQSPKCKWETGSGRVCRILSQLSSSFTICSHAKRGKHKASWRADWIMHSNCLVLKTP